MGASQTVRKTLRLDPAKLEKLRELFGLDDDAKAVRRAIDEALAYSEALRAARRIQRREKFAQDYAGKLS